MVKVIFKNFLVIIIAVFILACSSSNTKKMVVECKFPTETTPTGPALIAQEYGVISPIPLNAVHFTDESLVEQLAVQSLNTTRTATNTVELHARLLNCSDEPLVIGVRTHFLGNNQISEEPETAWKTMVIQPHALGGYRESSLSPAIQFYMVEIRDAH